LQTSLGATIAFGSAIKKHFQ